jgi:Spy/CpxP family protein refolding chaperone
MKRKVFTIALATLLVIGAISIAFSQIRGRRGRDIDTELGRRQRMIEQIPEELKLTEEQREKLQSLQTDFAKEMLPLRNDRQIKALELRQLWTADELDEEAILAKAGEISDLRNQMQEKMVLHRLEVGKILTKEQRTNFSPMGFKGHMRQRGRGFGWDGCGYGHGGRFGMSGPRMRRGPRWGR